MTFRLDFIYRTTQASGVYRYFRRLHIW